MKRHSFVRDLAKHVAQSVVRRPPGNGTQHVHHARGEEKRRLGWRDAGFRRREGVFRENRGRAVVDGRQGGMQSHEAPELGHGHIDAKAGSCRAGLAIGQVRPESGSPADLVPHGKAGGREAELQENEAVKRLAIGAKAGRHRQLGARDLILQLRLVPCGDQHRAPQSAVGLHVRLPLRRRFPDCLAHHHYRLPAVGAVVSPAMTKLLIGRTAARHGATDTLFVVFRRDVRPCRAHGSIKVWMAAITSAGRIAVMHTKSRPHSSDSG